MNDLSLSLEILSQLDKLPASYMQPESALRASVTLAMHPSPAPGELDASLARLEADKLILCTVDRLRQKRYAISPLGRATLQQA